MNAKLQENSNQEVEDNCNYPKHMLNWVLKLFHKDRQYR